MDRSQFLQLVSDNQERLRRYLIALCCGDSQLADDLAQETYIKAYLSLDSIREVGKFNSWILRIAYNTFLSNRRSYRPTADIDSACQVAAPAPDDYQALYLALDQISEKERSAILLYYIQGYQSKEIAEIMQSTDSAVKQLLSRGRTHLRNLLKLEQL